MLRLRFLLATALLSTCSAASAFDGLFVFGDSLSDRGNLALVIGSDPGQVISGNTYIPSRPYASGQFTNGNVWVQSFASAIGLAGFGLPSLAGGGDFAFGGARVAADGAGLPPSLSAQESLFLSATGGVAPSGALYVVAGGGNDARDVFAAALASATPNVVIAAAAATYAQDTGVLVDRLQAAGAQRIVVWDVPDIGLAPALAAFGPSASFLGSAIASAMNSALALRLSTEGSLVSTFDLYGLQDSIAANPGAYGLANVTDACGAPSNGCNPSTSLFWDGIHPTTAGHAIIASAMVAAVPEPSEITLVLGGLALIAMKARRRSR